MNRFCGRLIPLSHLCAECVAAGAELESARAQAVMRKRWRGIVGESLAATDLNHPGIARWIVTAATQWAQGPLEHFGLVGPSGIGKTRVVALVGISRAIMTGRSSMLLPAAELRDLSAMDHGMRAQAETRMAEACIAGVLFLDDIGKEGDGNRVSSATAAGMWRIVDHRYRTGRPMLWTSNAGPEDIAAAYPQEYSQKLARRLLDMGGRCRPA